MTTDTVNTFLRLLKELQDIDAEFPLQYAVCLAHISMNEGLSLTHLSQQTNMPLSTVSRIVGALSKTRQRGRPYELVEVKVSNEEKRRKELFLSDKGKNKIQNIKAVLKRARH